MAMCVSDLDPISTPVVSALVLRAGLGLAINVSGVIRISLKNEHGSLKSDQNFLWAVFNGEQEKVVLVFSL